MALFYSRAKPSYRLQGGRRIDEDLPPTAGSAIGGNDRHTVAPRTNTPFEFLMKAPAIAYHPSSVDARIIMLKSVA
jgi:hypothetical protein